MWGGGLTSLIAFSLVPHAFCMAYYVTQDHGSIPFRYLLSSLVSWPVSVLAQFILIEVIVCSRCLLPVIIDNVVCYW